MLKNGLYFCDRCCVIKEKSELIKIECSPNHEVCQDCHSEIHKVLFDASLIMKIMGKNIKKGAPIL